MNSANSVVVLDFETTGLSPTQGDRAIEIGAVKLQQGVIVDRFQQLINPGFRITHFIEQYTGITNAMLNEAPSSHIVMHDFADFMGDANLVAHNASFDQRFLDAELARIHRHYSGRFACSMLVARRIYPDASNHQLSTLVAHNRIEQQGDFHRALADAEMTALLWQHILDTLCQRWQCQAPSFAMMAALQKQPKANLERFFAKYADNQPS
ncbi:PolC-type DNA polymerase III [Shewanella algidipiscicola]|uniref:3'-5' exonuclease n=1 Tax=Shewanella algidipiscicola TaxID=614070 RepID=UPI000D787102|nr:3'-5' exonuclease [Shewanella algidipiscicola]